MFFKWKKKWQHTKIVIWPFPFSKKLKLLFKILCLNGTIIDEISLSSYKFIIHQ